MNVRPQHTVRMDDLTWEIFGDVARDAGTDRATLLRQFVLWYIRARGATMPPRPAVRSSESESADAIGKGFG